MSNNTDLFESPDSIDMKGGVTGVTRLSKKLKVTLVLGGFAIFCFFGYVIYTMDDGAPQPGASTTAADTSKGGSGMEPSRPDAVVKGIGDGQAMAGGGPVDPNSPAAVSPAFAINTNPMPAGIASATPPATGAKDTVPPLGSGKEAADAQAAAKAQQEREAQLKADTAKRSAWNADMDVQGFADAAAAGAPGAAALDAQIAALKNAAASAAAGAQPIAAPIAGQQDDQNKQVRKETFLKDAQKQLPEVYLKEVRTRAASPYQINAGWKIPAVLECGLNSDLPGMACARVREEVRDSATGQYVLIPPGTAIIGTYDSQVAVGQERVLVVWNRLIFPDGSSMSLQGMPGSDQAGNAGFGADVDNHYMKAFTGAILTSMVGAGIQLSQPQQSANNNQAPSVGQTMAGSLGQQLGTVSTNQIQRNLQVQPTLTVKPGYRFIISVTKDIVFPEPYRRRPATP